MALNVNSKLRVSVVVTNYNYGRYVHLAVESALAQITQPHEVVVIDDGSTDNSRELLAKRYRGHKLVNLIFQENNGQLSAFIAGVKASTGDVVCFLDADDTWDEQYLSVVRGRFALHTDVDFVYLNMIEMGSADCRVVSYGDSERDLGVSTMYVYRYGVYQGAATSAISIRRNQCLRVLDAIPESMTPEWKLCADACLVIGSDLLSLRKYFVPMPLVNYRIHERNGHFGSTFSFDTNLQHALRTARLIESLGRDLALNSPRLKRYVSSEFRTKSKVTFSELIKYVRMLRWIPGDEYRPFRQTWVMLRHYLKYRSS